MVEMESVTLRVRCANRPQAVENIKVQHRASWDVLQNAFMTGLSMALKSDEELYCVFVNSLGKVASPVICNDGNKFWNTYDKKYSCDTTREVVFEVNTRQVRQRHPQEFPLKSEARYQVPTNASTLTANPPEKPPHSQSDFTNQNLAVRTKAVLDSLPAKEMDIHAASKSGDLLRVQYLLKHFSSTLNAKDDVSSSTPLHYAAEHGHLALVEYFLSKRAFKNNRNVNGNTPLLNAIINGHIEIVKLLIENGAFTFIVNNEGNGPLHLAAMNDSSTVLEWLLKNSKIDKEIRNNKGELYSKYLKSPLLDSFGLKKANTAETLPSTILCWRIICSEMKYHEDRVIAMEDLDQSTWQNFCFSLVVLFDIRGVSSYLIKDKSTSKILPADNEVVYHATPTLIEYIVLVDQDGDEESGHVEDLSKLRKILKKVYREDDGMIFEIHVKGEAIDRCRQRLQDKSSVQQEISISKELSQIHR